MGRNVSVNNQPGLSAQNEITLENEFLQSTQQALNVYVTGGGTGGGDVNIDEIGGNPVASGAGATNNGTLRVVVANDQTPIETLEQTGMLPFEFDYISASYPDATTETYTYKSGGSGGTTEATITVVYTDSTKEFITSVTRS